MGEPAVRRFGQSTVSKGMIVMQINTSFSTSRVFGD